MTDHQYDQAVAMIWINENRYLEFVFNSGCWIVRGGDDKEDVFTDDHYKDAIREYARRLLVFCGGDAIDTRTVADKMKGEE